MDATQHEQQAQLEANDSRGKLQLRRILFGAGVSNVTTIDRKVTTRSITDTTSIFQR